jgi:predicted SnoaL-like aldol condensation-catalyzing enzyme
VLSNVALVRRVIDEIWNAGNIELADELFAPTYINHGGLIPDLVQGPEGVKFSVALYRSAFPGLHVAVDDVRVDKDAVTLCWTAGSQGPGDGADAVPGRMGGTLAGVTSNHVVDGQIQESWTSWDAALVLQRLGVVAAGHEETS